MVNVSFILPVYNVMPYLERCVESLLCQTYKDFEIILVDDGSPDDSGKLCDELAARDNRVRVIHQENKGLSGARNTGIDNAKGEYIIFVDSDDYWLLEDGLEKLVDNCEAATDLIAFKCVDIWKGERETRNADYDSEVASRLSNAQEVYSYLVTRQNFIMTAWIVMVRRQVLLDHHVYFPLRLIGEDFYWHCELWQHLHTAKMLNLDLYAYCHREGSMTTRKNLLAPYIDYDIVFDYWKERCRQGCVNADAILAFLATVWLNRAYRYYQLNDSDKKTAISILMKHADLLDHAIVPRTIKAAKLVHVFGVRISVVILGWYWRLRSKVKDNSI